MLFAVAVIWWVLVCFVNFCFNFFALFLREREQGGEVKWVVVWGSGRTLGWGKGMIRIYRMKTFSRTVETSRSSLAWPHAIGYSQIKASSDSIVCCAPTHYSWPLGLPECDLTWKRRL